MSQGFGLAKTNPNMLPQYQAMGLKYGHNGIDWSAIMGEDIRFNGTGKGTVIETSLDCKAGLGVVVFFEIEGKFYKTIYWHLLEVKVKVGDIVESGTMIGRADSTGWSTADHLHFGLKECNINCETLNRDNGMDGAIDPEPYLKNIYIQDYIDMLNKQLGLVQQVILLLKKLLGLKP